MVYSSFSDALFLNRALIGERAVVGIKLGLPAVPGSLDRGGMNCHGKKQDMQWGQTYTFDKPIIAFIALTMFLISLFFPIEVAW